MLTFSRESDQVPLDGVIRPSWRYLVVEQETSGEERINRINYEISTLQVLRDKLRCKEIWVPGSERYRNRMKICHRTLNCTVKRTIKH